MKIGDKVIADYFGREIKGKIVLIDRCSMLVHVRVPECFSDKFSYVLPPNCPTDTGAYVDICLMENVDIVEE